MISLRICTFALALGLTTSLTACQTGPVASTRSGTSNPQTARAAASYVLGVGDQVKITVFGQPDLSGQFEIDGSGAISMPLIGQLTALGESTPSLELAITAKLADGFLREPRVSAEVINYRPFFILGEVRTPGEYPYAAGLSVVNAVASAGGFSYRANKKVVFIKSVDSEGEESYQMNSNVMVQPGDTIRIGERIF